jgi:hypothetical protein
MIIADSNARFKYCLQGKGQEDFDRLVTVGSVLSSPEDFKAAVIFMAATSSIAENLANPDGEIVILCIYIHVYIYRYIF